MKKQLITILGIMLILMLSIPYNVFADYQGIDTNMSIGETDAAEASKDITANVLGIIQVAGSVVAVAGLAIIGIRYIFSSLEEKAQMKGVLGYYVTGCILVFATSNVVSLAWHLLDGVGHNWVLNNADPAHFPPSCTTHGKDVYICVDDGCRAKKYVKTTPLGHNLEEYIIDETCTTDRIIMQECTRCAARPSSRIVEGTAGHVWGEYTTVREMDCRTDKAEKRVCTRHYCNETDYRFTPTTIGHNLIDGEVIEASCTTNKMIKKICSMCDQWLDTEIVEGTAGHSLGSRTLLRKEGCVKIYKKECQRHGCFYEIYEVDGEHDFYEWYHDGSWGWHTECNICMMRLDCPGEYSPGDPNMYYKSQWED